MKSSLTSPSQTAQLLCSCGKKTAMPEQRREAWQEAQQMLGLSGEFVLSARLGAQGYTEEEAAMVSALFGR